MDISIRPVTPEIMRERGAQAFDNGHDIDDHDMNPWSPAVADWKSGWLARHFEVVVEGHQLQMSPP